MKNSGILISIIVPIYNAENTLEKCVFSILAQSYIDLQIILVDDGSTDSTFEISEQLAVRDKRIEVYHKENGGSVIARKTGLSMAKGQCIGFVDADDYIEPDMFQNLLETLTNTNADFVNSGYIEENEGKKRTFCDFPQEVYDVKDIQSKRNFMKSYIMRSSKNCVIAPSLCTKLFKAELIKKCFEALDDSQQYGEDFICLFRCILESRRIALYRKAMYHYLIKGKSLSHMNPDDYIIKEIGMWYHMLKVLEEYQYLEKVKDDICFFLERRMIQILSRNNHTNTRICQYYFKDIEMLMGKEIVLFGAGKVGKDYYIQFSKYKGCNIIAWADSHWYKYHFKYIEVVDLQTVLNMSFDFIIIAVRDEVTVNEIRNLLIKAGIPKSKIIWDEPGEFF